MKYILYPMGIMIFDQIEGWSSVSLDRSPDIMRDLASIADRCIMVFEGGADINPALYNEKWTYTHGVSAYRDEWEQACYKKAKELNIPVLGICRGHQFIAAMEGGKLHQDIRIEIGRHHSGRHKIMLTDLATTSGFLDLMQSNPLGCPDVVNSMHHQAVRDVPPSARVLARHADDNVVEALLYDHGVSVQWHPEFLGHREFVDWTYNTFSGARHVDASDTVRS